MIVHCPICFEPYLGDDDVCPQCASRIVNVTDQYGPVDGHPDRYEYEVSTCPRCGGQTVELHWVQEFQQLVCRPCRDAPRR